MNKTETIKSWYSRRVEDFKRQVEEEVKDDIARDEFYTSFAIVVVGVLIVLFFVAHQMVPTGFFTATFGILEMILLYGAVIYWIIVAALIVVSRKHLSRDIDAFGGIIFVAVAIAWLLVVFPFEFLYFADVLPVFLRFLLQWISNDIARVLMILIIIFHLVAAVYSLILRIHVRRALKEQKN
ncbi:MAG: hypothetical protein ACFFDI_06565 [Promethearchaeota archaeon]